LPIGTKEQTAAHRRDALCPSPGVQKQAAFGIRITCLQKNTAESPSPLKSELRRIFFSQCVDALPPAAAPFAQTFG